jgi:hypothetical protein
MAIVDIYVSFVHSYPYYIFWALLKSSNPLFHWSILLIHYLLNLHDYKNKLIKLINTSLICLENSNAYKDNMKVKMNFWSNKKK